MIAALTALAVALAPAGTGAAAAVPTTLVVATPRGESRLAVRDDPTAGPVLAARALAAALGGTVKLDGAWFEMAVAQQSFRVLVGAPFYLFNDRLEAFAAPVVAVQDTVFIPFQFVAEILPGVLSERFEYDSGASRLVEKGPRVTLAANPPRLPNGLRPGHLVTIDPGHGGIDPGNPGLYFPRGVTESDVALKMGLLLRDELKRRGVGVRMTRTTDTLIALGDRGKYCSDTCDLFVSIHVNSMPRRKGYTATNGFETYVLAEAKTEDAERVERLENEAIRFEAPETAVSSTNNLDFILRDLQLNEYLRESARAAELIQEHLDPVHSGDNRGVKQAGFVVLTTARRPAILVELGYSTNPSDGRLLSNPKSQRTMAYAMADAVVAYLLEYERKTGSAEAGGRP